LIQWSTKTRKLAILDFDIENRPLSYLGNDFTTGEITAIAWQWTSAHKPTWVALGFHKPQEMIQYFLDFYNRADVVTGHYILKHDLPAINAMCLEYGFPPLGEKLVSDTKIHLKNHKLVSASQESLAAMLGDPFPKVHMTQQDWREANRLTPSGIAATIKRVTGDVKQHMWLRAKLVELDMLKPPVFWRP